MQFDESSEGGIDLALSAGLHDSELNPLGAGRSLHVFYDVSSIRLVIRVHEQGNNFGLGNQLRQQLEPLGVQLGSAVAEPGEVATGPGETGDQAGRDRIT